MGQQPGFFDVDGRLRELSAKGDNLERMAGLVDFEVSRPEMERAVPRSNGTKGGRPASAMSSCSRCCCSRPCTRCPTADTRAYPYFMGSYHYVGTLVACRGTR